MELRATGLFARGGLIALVCLGMASATPVAAQNAERTMTHGVTGNATGTGFDNPGPLLSLPAVQAVVFEVADQPIDEARLRAMLSGTGAEPENLVRTSILDRRADGRYGLAMNFASADDQRLVTATAARYSHSLAEAFLARRDEFETLLGRYDLASVDDRLLAMALIGCVVLDWDGLGLTVAEGYRTGAPDRGELGQFVPWAREERPDVIVRALYWGSHNNDVGGATFSTFGDHHSLPRMGFPDIRWFLGHERIDYEASEDLRSEIARGARYGLAKRRDDALALMMALRDGPGSVAELAGRTEVSEEDVQLAIDLLSTLHYVAERDGRWETRVPVLTERDRPMIEAVRTLGREVMSAWLAENFAAFRNEMSSMTALRAGVPYGVIFTDHWHDIFGWTNYRLVQAGMLADPYGPELPFTGFIPFAHSVSLDLQEGTRALD